MLFHKLQEKAGFSSLGEHSDSASMIAAGTNRTIITTGTYINTKSLALTEPKADCIWSFLLCLHSNPSKVPDS